MLKDLSCDLIQTSNATNGKLTFHPGLNVVLGTSDGANSIGKSTTLLMIDFAYGGDAYLKSNAVEELGDHTINFTFNFDNTDFCFSRSTGDSEKVIQTSPRDGKLLEMSKKNFTDWLAEKYHINFEGLSFRNVLTRFFRIYGKNNYSEKFPMQLRGGTESKETAINAVISLFDKEKIIKPFQTQKDEANNMKKAFNNARKYQYLPSAVTAAKKYEENVKQLRSLKEDLQSIDSIQNFTITNSDVQTIQEIDSLNRDFQELRVHLKREEDDLNLINLNLKQGVYPTEADLKGLLEYFPGANIRKITEVEKFHNRIQSIIKEELLEAKEKTIKKITPLKDSCTEIEDKLIKLKPSVTFNKEFMETYVSISKKIERLENENAAYIKKKELDNNYTIATKRLEAHIKDILEELETEIQTNLNSISNFISRDSICPVIEITKQNSYQFHTPHDDGTGTNYKGMLIYDLSILKATALPALAHDSLLFSDISDKDKEKLIEYYDSQRDKQIFIAFDHQNSLSSDMRTILEDNCIVHLDSGANSLFGKQWSKK